MELLGTTRVSEIKVGQRKVFVNHRIFDFFVRVLPHNSLYGRRFIMQLKYRGTQTLNAPHGGPLLLYSNSIAYTLPYPARCMPLLLILHKKRFLFVGLYGIYLGNAFFSKDTGIASLIMCRIVQMWNTYVLGIFVLL